MQSSLSALGLSKDFAYLNPKQIKEAQDFNQLAKLEYKKMSTLIDRESFYTDINNTTRFLVAREFKSPKALEMWKKWYEWRIHYKVDELTDDLIFRELQSGKAFWHGYDKENHPCLIVKVKRHVPKETTVESSIRLAVYLLEKGIKYAEEKGESKVVVIWDREGFNKKNFDSSVFKAMKELSGVLQDYYAERLQTLFILHPNWFFKTVFKMVRPLLNQKTKNKVKILEKHTDLLTYFTVDNILMEHGGKSPFLYRFPPDAAPISDYPSNDQTIDGNDDDDYDENDPEMKRLADQLTKEM